MTKEILKEIIANALETLPQRLPRYNFVIRFLEDINFHKEEKTIKGNLLEWEASRIELLSALILAGRGHNLEKKHFDNLVGGGYFDFDHKGKTLNYQILSTAYEEIRAGKTKPTCFAYGLEGISWQCIYDFVKSGELASSLSVFVDWGIPSDMVADDFIELLDEADQKEKEQDEKRRNHYLAAYL